MSNKKSNSLKRVESRRIFANQVTAELLTGIRPLDKDVFAVFGETPDSMIKAGFKALERDHQLVFYKEDESVVSLLVKDSIPSGKDLINRVISISERTVAKVYNDEYMKIVVGNMISDTHIQLIGMKRILFSLSELRRIEVKAILAGGAVRDTLMDLTPNDFDYVVLNETVKSMLKAGFFIVGNDFPVFLHPETGDEYALARLERKSGKGYNGFSFSTKNVTFEEDSSRRDLTINSMGMLPDKTILDPFNGFKDIMDKVLRHTTEAFAEDPLRVLRVARFSARFPDFTIAEETIELAKSLREELFDLTPERVNKELIKTLESKKPSNYFRSLLLMDALDVLYPEIFDMIGVEQREDKHSEGDVFEHTMRVLDEVCLLTDDPVIRFAAIYHDIGKPSTALGNGSFRGHEDEDVVHSLIEKINTKGLDKKYAIVAKKVAIHHTFVHIFEEISTKKVVKRMMKKHFPKDDYELDALLTVSLADNNGRILGDRKLSFDEVEEVFSGDGIDGFTKSSTPDYYGQIKGAFTAFNRKVVKPEEVLNKHFEVIKQFEYREKLRRVATAIKENKDF